MRGPAPEWPGGSACRDEENGGVRSWPRPVWTGPGIKRQARPLAPAVGPGLAMDPAAPEPRCAPDLSRAPPAADLFEELASWDNLLLAYRQAAKRKRGRPEVALFEHRLEDNLLRLRAELLDGRYHPGPYRRFPIHEPKRRLVAAAPFRDRVVHHALCQCFHLPRRWWRPAGGAALRAGAAIADARQPRGRSAGAGTRGPREVISQPKDPGRRLT